MLRHVSMCVPQVRTYGCGIAAQTDTMRNNRYYAKYAPANNMREAAHAAKRLRMSPDGVAHPANNARVAMAACAHWSAHVDSRPQSTLRRAVVCASPQHFARA